MASFSNLESEGYFESLQVKVGANNIFLRRYGKGPAILMVHGFPRTSLMWQRLASKFALDHTVICPDIRGYGRSGVPDSTADHSPYSKRVIASELVSVMEKLGFSQFILIGHDRGGHVSYRMALDHPQKVIQLAIFDVIPVMEAWHRADARFFQTYWPWVLLSQQNPLPESYLLGAPRAVFENGAGHGGFGSNILEQYVRNFQDPARVHGICEEYRAAATLDIEHDLADKAAKRQIQCPTLHLWAEGGPLDTFYVKDGGSLGIWREWAPHVRGQAVRGGHFFPEENAGETATILRKFLDDSYTEAGLSCSGA
ncbi:alpha/beta fold hydrolase [Puia sp. P3]|uniref:alpha/beta fold hydrolase n=1 Tax=Puia sp. P3 TaxID=3423952 RepID=UPI003D6798BD